MKNKINFTARIILLPLFTAVFALESVLYWTGKSSEYAYEKISKASQKSVSLVNKHLPLED